MGYKALDALIEEKRGRLDVDDMKQMVLDDRDYVGELIMSDIGTWCGQKKPDLDAACQVLLRWDRKDTVGSSGAPFFREFWRRAMRIPSLWRRPFSKDAPLDTPAGLNLEDATVSKAIGTALIETAAQFQSLGLALDTTLAATQQRPSADGPIPLPGGPNFEGILNILTLGPLTRSGYGTESPLGSSYIQVVTWDDVGPVADALLTYGQSSDPDSPHYTDQTKAYVKGEWVRLPFTRKAIAADPTLKTQRIAQ
jgi:acyl-homoserine-lactone acylase